MKSGVSLRWRSPRGVTRGACRGVVVSGLGEVMKMGVGFEFLVSRSLGPGQISVETCNVYVEEGCCD